MKKLFVFVSFSFGVSCDTYLKLISAPVVRASTIRPNFLLKLLNYTLFLVFGSFQLFQNSCKYHKPMIII